MAIKQTGLGEQLARPLIGLCGGSYLRLIVGLVVMSLALTFVMPSTIGRTVLLIPIVVALADHLGLPAGSRSRNGFILATAVGTYMPAAAILPASVPNMVLYGTAETLHEIHLTYGRYLLLHLPITGLFKATVIVGLTWLLFRDSIGTQTPVEAAKPLTREQRVLIAVLLVALGLRMSDGWHHISPAWIGLGGALICLIPGIELVPYTAFHRDISLAPVVYVAGILGLGAVIAQSGLGHMLGQHLLGLLEVVPNQDHYTFASLIGMAITLGMATTMPGVPAVLTPFAPQLSQAVEWPILTVLMTQVIGYSTVLLPYQAPPIVLAMQLGGVSIAAGTRFLLALFATTVLVLMPLNYLWWCLLGYIGSP